jgi:hypothetical protein
VNAVQSTPSKKSKGNKKAKIKSKNTNNNEPPKNQDETPTIEKKPKWRLKFSCIICGDNHYTRYYPLRNEVVKLFQGNSQPIVLTQPFP